MNKDAPAFDFYPERWLVGTAAMSDAEQLSYLKLLCHQWMMDGLPEDPAVLKRLAGRGVTAAVLEKFPVAEDGRRRNRRLEIVRKDQRKRIADKSAQRKAAAEARWLKQRGKEPDSDAGRNAAASSPHMREGMRGDAHHPPPTTHHVLLEKEPKAPYPQNSEPDSVRALEAVISAYPKNGNAMEARRALALLSLTVPELHAVREKVLVLAGRMAALPESERRFCPAKHTFFAERRWEDDPAGMPWTVAFANSPAAPPAEPRKPYENRWKTNSKP